MTVTLKRKKMDAPAGHRVTVHYWQGKYDDGNLNWESDKLKELNYTIPASDFTIKWYVNNDANGRDYELKVPSGITHSKTDPDYNNGYWCTLSCSGINSDITIKICYGGNKQGSQEVEKLKKYLKVDTNINASCNNKEVLTSGDTGSTGTGEYIDDDGFEAAQKAIDSTFSATQTLTSPGYTYTWIKLPLKDGNNNLYKYYIEEAPLPGYSTEILNNEVTAGTDGKLHGTVNVYNKKSPQEETGTLTVDKKWFMQDGQSADDADNAKYQVRFALYRQEIKADNASEQPASLTDTSKVSRNEEDWMKIGEYLIGPSSTGTTGNVSYGSWKATFANLLKSRTYPGEEGGTYYIYKVAEVQIIEDGVVKDPAIYNPQYKPGADGISITIENTHANEYGAELPHTGGPGTTVIYLIAVMLIVGAGVLRLAHRRR